MPDEAGASELAKAQAYKDAAIAARRMGDEERAEKMAASAREHLRRYWGMPPEEKATPRKATGANNGNGGKSGGVVGKTAGVVAREDTKGKKRPGFVARTLARAGRGWVKPEGGKSDAVIKPRVGGASRRRKNNVGRGPVVAKIPGYVPVPLKGPGFRDRLRDVVAEVRREVKAASRPAPKRRSVSKDKGRKAAAKRGRR